MSSYSNAHFLLVLIFTSTFHFSSSQLTYNAREDTIEVVSGEGNLRGKLGSAIFTRLRFLFGMQSSKSKNPSHSFSRSPAPAPAPSPSFPTHIYSLSPFSHKSHSNKHAHRLNDGKRDRREKSRFSTVLIAVLVSVGSALVVISFVSVFLVCKRSQRRRIQSSGGNNKVSYDPDPGPDLFYLNSLTPILDVESSFKHPSQPKLMWPNENMSSYIPSNDGEVQLKSESETVSCRDEEIPKQSCELKNVLLEENILGSNQSDTASCLDEEILYAEHSSSDDEIFHSACNSRSSIELASIASKSNVSCESGMCSPHNSSNGSSPHFVYPTYSPSKNKHPRRPLQNFRDTPRRTSQSTMVPYDHPSNHELNSIPNSTNLVPPDQPPPFPSSSKGNVLPPPPPPSPSITNGNIPRPPPPPSPLPSIRNGNIPRQPLPPPPLPSLCNGNVLKRPPAPMSSISDRNVPKPPPPPLLQFGPSSLNASKSMRPPPPPPIHFQQSAQVGKDGAPLPKLKPLHWVKVRAAPDRSMVWDKIRSSSFELDEEMIESLFSYNSQRSTKNEETNAKSSSPGKHVLDNKRLHNITILLKALNASSEQICEALIQGRGLSTQQLEALVRMVPTKEEEEKLFDYQGDLAELSLAERFVKAILNVPFAFSRIQVMLYRETFEDEVVHLRKSFKMLEEACKELRSSWLFFRLLEAVLKTGNRMNVGTIRGGARAFKLDTLLKLADVKGTDGKTTLLHFVVQEIIRSEGINTMEKGIRKNQPKTAEEREEGYRVKGLNIVSGLSTELCNAKKTASIDLDVLASSVSNLMEGWKQLKHMVEVDLSNGEETGSFVNSMKPFLAHSERAIVELKKDEDQVLVHVREITEYYHGDVSKDEENPLRIFVIVRDFLGMLDRVCKEIRNLK